MKTIVNYKSVKLVSRRGLVFGLLITGLLGLLSCDDGNLETAVEPLETPEVNYNPAVVVHEIDSEENIVPIFMKATGGEVLEQMDSQPERYDADDWALDSGEVPADLVLPADLPAKYTMTFEHLGFKVINHIVHEIHLLTNQHVLSNGISLSKSYDDLVNVYGTDYKKTITGNVKRLTYKRWGLTFFIDESTLRILKIHIHSVES